MCNTEFLGSVPLVQNSREWGENLFIGMLVCEHRTDALDLASPKHMIGMDGESVVREGLGVLIEAYVYILLKLSNGSNPAFNVAT